MILLPAILAVCALRAGGTDPLPPVVTWKDLCASPTTWLGRTVRLRVQYSETLESWNPYLTRFSPARFAGVQGWADEQFPWIPEDYEAPCVRVFVRRGSAGAWAFENAERGSRHEVTGVVRELFLDLPWIEVTEVVPLAERITEGAVIHAAKARELMQARSFELAGLELDQAITDSLPPLARSELERMRATCRQEVEAERTRKGPVPERG